MHAYTPYKLYSYNTVVIVCNFRIPCRKNFWQHEIRYVAILNSKYGTALGNFAIISCYELILEPSLQACFYMSQFIAHTFRKFTTQGHTQNIIYNVSTEQWQS